MLAGGLAQMTSNNFGPGLGMPTGGLASRRGGQTIKPLSFENINKQGAQTDNGVPTPRTARGHLLAGLRTAPKTSTATSFAPMSPTTNNPQQQFARNNGSNGNNADNVYNPPKTAFPQYNNQSGYNNAPDQQYTVDQVLAPPELPLDEQAQEYMEPQLYEQLVATNMYLAQQQQRLQQQLRSVQAAAQQFQQLNLSNPQLNQQQMMLYQQQQHVRNLQQQLSLQAAMSQGQQVYYHAATGQYLVDTSNMGLGNSYGQEQQSMNLAVGGLSQQQQQQLFQQQMQQNMPRVQVSPPPENQIQAPSYRSNSPPKRYDSPQTEVTPLPPPSANAFRRGHKKSTSLAPVDSALAAAVGSDGPKSAGPRTANFPLTPMTGTYGPGQARAGEHPVRQPRGPPSLDELKAKPTAKHEGSKNFATRTRRSAVSNLMRAGNLRRKGTSSSAGSMSPVSETAEESATPITDNDSDSGRSGSGSLAGEMDCGDSQTSASGSWGAIGSNRPSSREKISRSSADSAASDSESNSFANLFKNRAAHAKEQEQANGQRKAPRLVLTSVEKRKTALN